MLTDEQYFGGKLEYIAAVKEAVPLPVLRKDFIIDPYQVWEARAAGADAILLIAEILTDSLLIDLQILAAELRLTTLIEVHEMDSLLRVRSAIGFPLRSYCLLGINNRDLRTFKTDLTTTLRLAEFVEDKQMLVAESGIKDSSGRAADGGGGGADAADRGDADAERRRGGDDGEFEGDLSQGLRP